MQNIEGHSLIYVRLMNFWPFNCCGCISNNVQFHLGRFFLVLLFCLVFIVLLLHTINITCFPNNIRPNAFKLSPQFGHYIFGCANRSHKTCSPTLPIIKIDFINHVCSVYGLFAWPDFPSTYSG